MTIANPEQFDLKDKPVTYIGAFVKLDNQWNYAQVHEMYEIIELVKIRFLTAKNSYNLCAYWIIDISLLLYNTHVIPKNQDKFVFYVNNYIDWNLFNKLYNPDQIKNRSRKCRRNCI